MSAKARKNPNTSQRALWNPQGYPIERSERTLDFLDPAANTISLEKQRLEGSDGRGLFIEELSSTQPTPGYWNSCFAQAGLVESVQKPFLVLILRKPYAEGEKQEDLPLIEGLGQLLVRALSNRTARNITVQQELYDFVEGRGLMQEAAEQLVSSIVGFKRSMYTNAESQSTDGEAIEKKATELQASLLSSLSKLEILIISYHSDITRVANPLAADDEKKEQSYRLLVDSFRLHVPSAYDSVNERGLASITGAGGVALGHTITMESKDYESFHPASGRHSCLLFASLIRYSADKGPQEIATIKALKPSSEDSIYSTLLLKLQYFKMPSAKRVIATTTSSTPVVAKSEEIIVEKTAQEQKPPAISTPEPIPVDTAGSALILSEETLGSISESRSPQGQEEAIIAAEVEATEEAIEEPHPSEASIDAVSLFSVMPPRAEDRINQGYTIMYTLASAPKDKKSLRVETLANSALLELIKKEYGKRLRLQDFFKAITAKVDPPQKPKDWVPFTRAEILCALCAFYLEPEPLYNYIVGFNSYTELFTAYEMAPNASLGKIQQIELILRLVCVQILLAAQQGKEFYDPFPPKGSSIALPSDIPETGDKRAPLLKYFKALLAKAIERILELPPEEEALAEEPTEPASTPTKEIKAQPTPPVAPATSKKEPATPKPEKTEISPSPSSTAAQLDTGDNQFLKDFEAAFGKKRLKDILYQLQLLLRDVGQRRYKPAELIGGLRALSAIVASPEKLQAFNDALIKNANSSADSIYKSFTDQGSANTLAARYKDEDSPLSAFVRTLLNKLRYVDDIIPADPSYGDVPKGMSYIEYALKQIIYQLDEGTVTLASRIEPDTSLHSDSLVQEYLPLISIPTPFPPKAREARAKEVRDLFKGVTKSLSECTMLPSQALPLLEAIFNKKLETEAFLREYTIGELNAGMFTGWITHSTGKHYVVTHNYDGLFNSLYDTMRFTEDLPEGINLLSGISWEMQKINAVKRYIGEGKELTREAYLAKELARETEINELIRLKEATLRNPTEEGLKELTRRNILEGNPNASQYYGRVVADRFIGYAALDQGELVRETSYEPIPPEALVILDRIFAADELEKAKKAIAHANGVRLYRVQQAKGGSGEATRGLTSEQRVASKEQIKKLKEGAPTGLRVEAIPDTRDKSKIYWTVRLPQQPPATYNQIVKLARPGYYSSYQAGFIYPKAATLEAAKAWAEELAEKIHTQFNIPYEEITSKTESEVSSGVTSPEKAEEGTSQTAEAYIEAVDTKETELATRKDDKELEGELEAAKSIDEKLVTLKAKLDKLKKNLDSERNTNTARLLRIAAGVREDIIAEMFYVQLFINILDACNSKPQEYLFVCKIKHLSQLKALCSLLLTGTYLSIQAAEARLDEDRKKNILTYEKWRDASNELPSRPSRVADLSADARKKYLYEAIASPNQWYQGYLLKGLSDEPKQRNVYRLINELRLTGKTLDHRDRTILHKLLARKSPQSPNPGIVPLKDRANLENLLEKLSTKARKRLKELGGLTGRVSYDDPKRQRIELCREFIGSVPELKRRLFWNVEPMEALYKLGAVDAGDQPVLLRVLLRELAGFITKTEKEELSEERQIADARKKFARMGIPGFFPTPPAIVERVIEAADIEEGDSVLEPSAGTGYLADAAMSAGGDVKVIEYDADLRKFLEKYEYAVVGKDCLEHTGQYDKVVMNPPFESKQDIEHVTYCFNKNLKPGGRLVAIMSARSAQRGDRTTQAFKELVDEYGYYENLPEGSFMGSDRKTGVNTILVVLDKPGPSPTKDSETTESIEDTELQLEDSTSEDGEEASGASIDDLLDLKEPQSGEEGEATEAAPASKNPFEDRAIYSLELQGTVDPRVDPDKAKLLALDTLKYLVSLPSSSDRQSKAIPSTADQKRFAAKLKTYWESILPKRAGSVFSIELDSCYNVLARLEALNAPANARPLALMAHYDTVPQTRATSRLNVLPNWDGHTPIPYPSNNRIKATVESLPVLEQFVGEDVIYGPGDAPVGLDDKLGLTHLITLAQMLISQRNDPRLSHPTIYFIARPDEEIGSQAVLEPLLRLFQEKEIAFVYTVDGVNRFDVNATCFNAGSFMMKWPKASKRVPDYSWQISIRLEAVPAHTATAYEEKYKPAIRIFSELVQELRAYPSYRLQSYLAGHKPAPNTNVLAPSAGTLKLLVPTRADIDIVKRLMLDTLNPYTSLGAYFDVTVDKCAEGLSYTPELVDIFDFLAQFKAKPSSYNQYSEETREWDGFCDPTQLFDLGDSLELIFRVRDFTAEGLAARSDFLSSNAQALGVESRFTLQHESSDSTSPLPRLAYEIPLSCGELLDLPVTLSPFRAGTGTETLTKNGIFVSNLGTGYFAPENHKELTSMEMLYEHPLWLFHICQAFSQLEQAEQQIAASNQALLPTRAKAGYRADARYALGDQEEHIFGTSRLELAYCPNDLWVSKHQIQQELWEHTMGTNPSMHKNAKHPVEGISLAMAMTFCNRLSGMEGLQPCYRPSADSTVAVDLDATGYRLLTEAEWEQCASAGQSLYFAGSNELEQVGWYCGNSGRSPLPDTLWDREDAEVEALLAKAGCSTHPVGELRANRLGLYDMSGNIWEWCMPANVVDTKRLLPAELYPVKGGSYMNCTADCAINGVLMVSADTQTGSLGLRICRKSSVL